LNVDVTIDPVSGGGCAERTFQMCRALGRLDVDCRLMILDIGLTEERIRALGNVDVTVLPLLNRRFYIPRPPPGQIARLVRNADVVHLMGHWESTDALVYPYLRRFRKPYVNCPAGSLRVYGRSKGLKRLHDRLVGRRIVRHADRMIAISPDEIDEFEAYGVERHRIEWIPNGIDPDDYRYPDRGEFRSRYGIGNDPFILFMGRLNHIKGPDLLLDAFARIQDRHQTLHLVFAGPDEGLGGCLRERADEAGIGSRVHITGFIGGRMKSEALHAANQLVIPSRREAMSIVVLEAGAAGTPVLATDQCGLNEIASIDAGRIVPVSSDRIAEALAYLLDDSERLQTMGENLKRYVLERFTWDSIGKRFVTLYRNILES